MYNKVADLVYYTRSVDADGFTTKTEVSNKVSVGIESVGRTEKYTAMKADKNPTILFKMRKESWALSKHTVDGRSRYAEQIRYDGELFDVIRDYADSGEVVVTCG